MKKLLFLVMVVIGSSFALSAQTVYQPAAGGDLSLVGQAGYQTNYERFGIGAQLRYSFMRNIRIAPDIMFFFPKDKTTGLDVNLNAHYVFYFPQDRFSVYPLAGFAMQNNFRGSETVTDGSGNSVKIDSKSKTNLGFNLGGGISYQVMPNGYLNAEAKFMFGDEDAAVIMIGYGFRF